MQIEALLQYETLRYGETGTGREEFLLKIGERCPELADIFFPFDESGSPRIEEQVNRLRYDGFSLIREDDMKIPSSVKKIGRWKRTLAGKKHSKLREVAAVAVGSGILDDTQEVHIHDACCGSGILSCGIAYLRGEPQRTSAFGFEIDPKLRGKYEFLKFTLGKRNELFQFCLGDIRDSDFAAQERRTYLLAKHACGSATDILIDKVAQLPLEKLPQATLLTCCHSKAKDSFPFEMSKAFKHVSPEEWNLLARTAGWPPEEYKHLPEFQIVGRVAMRIMDCLRVLYLKDHLRGRVQELLSPAHSSRNHGILIEAQSEA